MPFVSPSNTPVPDTEYSVRCTAPHLALNGQGQVMFDGSLIGRGVVVSREANENVDREYASTSVTEVNIFRTVDGRWVGTVNVGPRSSDVATRSLVKHEAMFVTERSTLDALGDWFGSVCEMVAPVEADRAVTSALEMVYTALRRDRQSQDGDTGELAARPHLGVVSVAKGRSGPTLTAMLVPLFVFAGAILSCAPKRVAVEGTPSDVSRLEGEWVGAYSSFETGRHGDIGFLLEAGTDTAFGDVVMIPHTDHDVMPAIDEPYDPEFETRFLSQGLTIQFVAVAGTRVSGELSPYRDPDCGCQLRTLFEGVIKGDVIEGDFRSTHLDSGDVKHGEWRVTRKKPKELRDRR